MPRDASEMPTSTLPPWLCPRLLRVLARQIETDMARGLPHHLVAQTARERAQALRPGLPASFISEALALAMWLARAPGPEA